MAMTRIARPSRAGLFGIAKRKRPRPTAAPGDDDTGFADTQPNDRTWSESSQDLLDGLDVHDCSDMVAEDVLDDLRKE
jgi:hypothetical protein